MVKQKELLLVLPVPFRVTDNQLLFESQACNGLERWADNFGSVVVAGPTLPESIAEHNKTIVWRDTATLTDLQRFEFVPLPWGYPELKFISCYYSVRGSLAKLISRCRYLHLHLSDLFGDWAAVAAIEAYKQGRAYAIHTDRVEHEVIIRESREAKLKTRLKTRVIAPLMARYHRGIIKNCAVALLHGNDCYSAYSSLCKNSYLIHNIHTKHEDCISSIELLEKSNRAIEVPIIQLCYAGRMAPMKAPIDWIKAIKWSQDLGVNLQAIWLGDGFLLNEMQTTIAQLDLQSCIELRGFEQDRKKLLKIIRESHIFLFTHVTPESPRCLIESLVGGTPIIGYQSQYAEELVKDFGGGMFVPINDWKQLGELIVTLYKDRQRLSQLIKEAGQNGSRFNDEAVFRERSELIKRHLP